MTALPITSTFLIGSRRSLRLIERNLYVYRHGWIVIFSGFFEPLFYLLSIGFGLGALIGTVPGPDGQPIPYQLFVAPALLATAAMNGAISESTFNFFFKLNYNKTFTSILATPLSPGDVATGELGWALIRGGLYAIGFMVVMALLGLVVSPWVILAGPAALLVGFAFGAVGMAATSFMRTWQDFDLIQLVVLPMFLFSATFYPIETYPPVLQVVVRLTPLYQGVDLIRSLTVGRDQPDPAGPRRVPVGDGAGRAGGHVAAARQAPAQVSHGPGGPRGAVRRDRRVPALSAAGRVARAGRASRRSRGSATRRTGAGRCPASATRMRGSCCWAWRRRRTAATGPGGCSPAMRAGDFLWARLFEAGLADRPSSRRADDGLTLTDAYIAAAVRCAPPANKPTTEERDTCAPFLVRELALLESVRVVVALGQFGWDAALRAFGGAGACGARRGRGSGTSRRLGSGRTRCSARTTRASRTRSPAG